MLERKFTAGEVTAATGMAAMQLQNWQKRGLLIGHKGVGEGIEGGGAYGRHRTYSFRTLIGFALAKRLVDMSFTPKRALEAVAEFSYTGVSPSGWTGDPEPIDLGCSRLPGLPFHHEAGETYLVVWAGGQSVQVSHGTDDLSIPLIAKQNGFVLLPCHEIFYDVMGNLGVTSPLAFLDEVYNVHA